jgi:thioredoxin reductase (NADPH)
VAAADLGDRWVVAGDRRLRADAIVIATGGTRRKLAAAPDGACDGDVTYQLERDPERFVGRAVAVVGGGDSAALDALELAAAGSPVVLLHRSEALSARADIVAAVRAQPGIDDLAGWELEKLVGADHLEAIEIVHPDSGQRRRAEVGGVVVKISYEPATDPFRGQLELDAHGAVVVDAGLRTSRPAVFAAGDVTAGAYPRIATAVGQGLLAARSVLRQIEGR